MPQRRDCDRGDDCSFLREGRCRFNHNNLANVAVTAPVILAPKKPNTPAPQISTQDEDLITELCNNFEQGYCGKVKCKNQHNFGNHKFNLKDEQNIRSGPKETFICSSLMRDDTELILVGQKGATIHKYPELNQVATIPFKTGTSSIAKCFDQDKNFLFFGVSAGTGQPSAIKIVTSSCWDLTLPNAHQNEITCFELLKTNDSLILFSGSRDMKLNAWSIDKNPIKLV